MLSKCRLSALIWGYLLGGLSPCHFITNYAGKRSGVDFRCGIFIWQLLPGIHNMRSKELSMQVKQAAIIRLRNKNKSIRELAETLGVAESTVWYILWKKERTGELGTQKGLDVHGRQQRVDDDSIFSMVKKNPFTTSSEMKKTLQEVGVSLSKSTIKRRHHESKYRGFTKRCKPFTGLKNRKASLEFDKTHLKKPAQFWNSILWTY